VPRHNPRDPRGDLLSVVNDQEGADGPSWISSLLETDCNTPLVLEEARIKNYTIPLVYENRYFLVELYEGKELWSVFWFKDDQLVIDFLRNVPRKHEFGDCDIENEHELVYKELSSANWLYRIMQPGLMMSSISLPLSELSESGDEAPDANDRDYRLSSTIFVAYSKSILKYGVQDGCLIISGPMCVTNVAERGSVIPMGATTWKDYRIDFRRETPKLILEKLAL
jgi:hypothetical protein